MQFIIVLWCLTIGFFLWAWRNGKFDYHYLWPGLVMCILLVITVIGTFAIPVKMEKEKTKWFEEAIVNGQSYIVHPEREGRRKLQKIEPGEPVWQTQGFNILGFRVYNGFSQEGREEIYY